MPRYRMQALATLCFDIEAATEEEATAKADALLERLEDGVDVDNVDTEDELTGAVLYPDSAASPAQGVPRLSVLDVSEEG